jgi:hypothetical protein
LYGSLVWYRDLDPEHRLSGQGAAWPTNAKLSATTHTRHGAAPAEKRSVSNTTYRRALRKLKDCGLVEQHAYHFRPPDVHAHPNGAAVRTVRGRIRREHGTKLVDIPADVFEKLEREAKPRARKDIVDARTLDLVDWYRRRARRFLKLWEAGKPITGPFANGHDGVDWPALFVALGPRPAGAGLGFVVDPCALAWPGVQASAADSEAAIKRHAAGVFSPSNVRWASRAELLTDARRAASRALDARADPKGHRARRKAEVSLARLTPCQTKSAPLPNQIGPLKTIEKGKNAVVNNGVAPAEPGDTSPPGAAPPDPPGRQAKPSPSEEGKAGGSKPAWTPRYPAIGAVTISPPPLLREGMADRDMAIALVVAYRAAIERVYGIRSFAFARGDVRKNKHYAKLVECARALLRHECEPHGWAAFSFEQIRHAKERIAAERDGGEESNASGKSVIKSGGDGRPPPITVVFSAKRVEKWHGWYRAERASYVINAEVVPDSVRQLVQEWTNWMYDANRVGVSEAAEKYWPGGQDEYERLIARARNDALQIKQRAEEDAAKGRWVWG